MRRCTGPLARLRPVAGPLLLTVFVGAAQVVPVRHLAIHRGDHTHGPEVAPADDHDHLPVAGHDVDDQDHDADLDHHGTPAEPGHGHGEPSNDHGRGSSAHFGLALIDGPPPPFLPPPPETIAPAPDDRPGSCRPAPPPQPPARGPPITA